MKIFFVVTHLLGTGHLARTLTLAHAFRQAGHKAVIISGGMPAPHLDATGLTVLQLPPLRSDGTNFKRLLDDLGREVDARYRSLRQADLLSHLKAEKPDVVVTELFPFGRRTLRHEFGALVDAANKMEPQPLILSSIRDILAPPSKPDRIAATHDLIETRYDAVLVHSVEQLVPLHLSWPLPDALVPRLRYTGFVAPELPEEPVEKTGEILISAGGGAIADPLFDTAITAAKHRLDRPWRMFLGGRPDRVKRFSRAAPSNMRVEATRSDFRQIMTRAAASVSLCGYNTTMDVLQTGIPAVFVPFDDGDEQEQTIRANALKGLTGVEVLTSSDLTPEALLKALDLVEAAPARKKWTTEMAGAKGTVAVVETLLQERLS